MDFTVIPNSVRKTLQTAGHPLTEDQFILMAGALAAVQQMIETTGLESTIEILEPMADLATDKEPE